MEDHDGIRVGARVVVKDKGYKGVVKFVGVTSFAPGKWVGVELDDTKGKNNGTVQGKAYFQSRENHGLFVRQNQLQLLPAAASGKSPGGSKSPGTSSRIPGPSRVSAPGSGSSHLKKPTSGTYSQTSPGKHKSGHSPPSKGKGAAPQTKEVPTIETSPASAANPTPASFVPDTPVSDEVTDLKQRLAILQAKRAEDKGRIKELERYKAQFNQMVEYKQRWSESQTELQQQLKVAKKEAREHQLDKEKAEEEMRDLADTVEMTTLDKEMAEERCESMQAENEVLKEKIEELTIDLEIIKQEISEGGVEGAAATAQYKQMEQQNNRLKDALVRLRDLSAQDKLEHQRAMKDLEKTASELTQLKEQKDKLSQEIQECDAIIDELKEQVDAALGAEEMVEKLTDRNLEQEEKIEQLTETVSDLEALRDLSEEQEELRMEVEHDLREELDMNLNSIRQLERKVEAGQETIVDQQQTIEKFRDLVRHLQSDIAGLKERGDRPSESQGSEATQAMMNINVQLKSAIKAHSRTIDFELRKLDAQQANDHINLLKSFMPNSFLVSGGDYDALLVLMLLPRLAFKAELVIDQLKQQHKLDEALGSLSTIKTNQADQLAFVCLLIYKLYTLQMLVTRANSVLQECDVMLYRQMGGVRDDLNIHEKALDILIELLKKEQLDESVPLHGIDKAIGHFESLLEGRLHYEGSVRGNSGHLLEQMKALCSGADFTTIELLRLRQLAPENSQFVAQVKELESFNNDVRQACRKIRRKVPPVDSQRILKFDSPVQQSVAKTLRRQLLFVEAFKALHLKASQRANSLTEGEKLTSGELEEFTRQVIASGTLQEVGSEAPNQQPRELLRHSMSTNSTALEKFLGSLSEGDYDTQAPKTVPEPPVVVRAKSVKGELSDIEGLRFKLEERQQDIMELRKTLKMKGQDLSEANVKIGLLEKKVESTDTEIGKRVSIEREEVQRIKENMDEQERKFNKTIEILQGDIEALENEKLSLEKKLDQSKKTSLSDITVGRRSRGSPFGSPFAARKTGITASVSASVVEVGGAVSVSAGVGGDSAEQALQSPLLLARIESLKKALGFSQDENFNLKCQIAKAQLNSLPPLRVPGRLLKRRSGESSEEIERETINQTDQEKGVLKRTAALIEDLRKLSLVKMVSLSVPQGGPSPQEQLANQLARISEMQRKTQQLKEDVNKLLASQHPGGLISNSVTSFTTPQFTKALSESSGSAVLTARLRLPPRGAGTSAPPASARPYRIILSPAQFDELHSVVAC